MAKTVTRDEFEALKALVLKLSDSQRQAVLALLGPGEEREGVTKYERIVYESMWIPLGRRLHLPMPELAFMLPKVGPELKVAARAVVSFAEGVFRKQPLRDNEYPALVHYLTASLIETFEDKGWHVSCKSLLQQFADIGSHMDDWFPGYGTMAEGVLRSAMSASPVDLRRVELSR